MPDTPAPVPEAPKPKLSQKLTRWFIAIALIISGVGGIVKGFGSYFFLPSCDSTTASDTLKGIFKSKDVELAKVSDATTLTSTSAEKTCQANIETSDELAAIAYRIYWDGWSATVMITKVDAKPK
jgi:hypothetical protein